VRRGVVVNAVIPALVGAAFGVVSALLLMRYPQKTIKVSLQTAYLGEIEVILIAVRGAAKNAFSAWQENRDLAGQKFSYSRAIFDGNVAHLGEVGDKQLVRDIAFLYAVLEQAQKKADILRVMYPIRKDCFDTHTIFGRHWGCPWPSLKSFPVSPRRSAMQIPREHGNLTRRHWK
jgi:predicted membrane chloride channel (bestrophin family)